MATGEQGTRWARGARPWWEGKETIGAEEASAKTDVNVMAKDLTCESGPVCIQVSRTQATTTTIVFLF